MTSGRVRTREGYVPATRAQRRRGVVRLGGLAALLPLRVPQPRPLSAAWLRGNRDAGEPRAGPRCTPSGRWSARGVQQWPHLWEPGAPLPGTLSSGASLAVKGLHHPSARSVPQRRRALAMAPEAADPRAPVPSRPGLGAPALCAHRGRRPPLAQCLCRLVCRSPGSTCSCCPCNSFSLSGT